VKRAKRIERVSSIREILPSVAIRGIHRSLTFVVVVIVVAIAIVIAIATIAIVIVIYIGIIIVFTHHLNIVIQNVGFVLLARAIRIPPTFELELTVRSPLAAQAQESLVDLGHHVSRIFL